MVHPRDPLRLAGSAPPPDGEESSRAAGSIRVDRNNSDLWLYPVMKATFFRTGRASVGLAVLALATAACTPAADDPPTTASSLPPTNTGLLPTTGSSLPPATTGSPPTTSKPVPATVPPGPEFAPIIIGVEYVLLDSPRLIERQADMLGEVGFHASKPLAESISWGAMQSGPDSPIDFSKLDDYVIEFQAAGISEIVLALKSHSTWASVDHALLRSRNAAPQVDFRDDYAAWITAIVERYDADGIDDMPGLVYPIRHYEIGSEFSSYEPEPVAEYLSMLEIAYAAAHAAYADVSVGHAAFLVTDFLLGDPAPDTIDDDTGVDLYGPHAFSEIRAILDRPELFDVLNVHALAHPGEIEQMVRWLNWEMDQRGYTRPIIISDTSINPFISFGPAIDCERIPQLMGLTIYPATEADRCRIADYFNRVLDGDPDTVEWMRAFVAADMVKKVVIAAEQRIVLINTAFTTDLPILDSRLGQAGAGNAGWGGMIEISSGTRHANFYAMQQLIGHIDGYTGVARIDVGGPEGTRVYRFVVDGEPLFVAWYDPPFLVLHGDPAAETAVALPTGPGAVTVERMIEGVGQTKAEQVSVAGGSNGAEVTLNQTPIYVWVDG